MKTAIQYLNDKKGNAQAVRVPITQWTRLISRLHKYEQMLELRSDLARAVEEVKKIRQGKIKKQNLRDFLNEI